LSDQLRKDLNDDPEISKLLDEAKSIIMTLLDAIESNKPISADEIRNLVKTAKDIFSQLSKREDAKELTKRLVSKGKEVVMSILQNPNVKKLLLAGSKLLGDIQTNDQLIEFLKTNVE